jgi:hypothetical protein
VTNRFQEEELFAVQKLRTYRLVDECEQNTVLKLWNSLVPTVENIPDEAMKLQVKTIASLPEAAQRQVAFKIFTFAIKKPAMVLIPADGAPMTIMKSVLEAGHEEHHRHSRARALWRRGGYQESAVGGDRLRTICRICMQNGHQKESCRFLPLNRLFFDMTYAPAGKMFRVKFGTTFQMDRRGIAWFKDPHEADSRADVPAELVPLQAVAYTTTDSNGAWIKPGPNLYSSEKERDRAQALIRKNTGLAELELPWQRPPNEAAHTSVLSQSHPQGSSTASSSSQ